MGRKKIEKIGTISGKDILKKTRPPQDIPFRTGWDETEMDRPRKKFRRTDYYEEDVPLCDSCRHYPRLDADIEQNWRADERVSDCPYASEWCSADDEANTLCDNMYEPRTL